MADLTHESVLLTEAIESLEVEADDVILDATVGGAGHFALLAGKLGEEGTLIGIDADEEAIQRAGATAEGASARVILANDNFRNLGSILDKHGIETIDKALFDLGWSSFQLARGRGFSFRVDEPLLMTYGDPNEGVTARDMVNTLEEGALADLIYTLGEERFSRGIAKSIARMREAAPIETTFELVAAIEAGVPAWYAHRRLHPATKTFQALRIAVNDEFGALREGLEAALAHLSEGGRVAVITFHSIEDRIVKGMFRDAAHAGRGTVLTKKPLTPSSEEVARNPRARSAKLRVFERANGHRSFISSHSFVAYA
ncbi:MAG TPA: 16S rRNA (cytosine(1402)-N(4))-methyltransferase RsmH [Candidatus Paceibacterota bacterium]|nr:16S rRNA (cytosine(1402)-N(4))-methyltransferase RsmH [Candidatus Paceibacterota bacterium]